jgi:hypothetical protein
MPTPRHRLRTLASLLTSALLAGWLEALPNALGASQEQLVTVYVDGQRADFRPPARVRQGVAYAPLRAAAQALGAKVQWLPKGQLAVLCKGNQCVPIHKNQGIVVQGSLLVPLRVLAEALHCTVRYEAATQAIYLSASHPHAGSLP